jgi:ankyrin repeat protein
MGKMSPKAIRAALKMLATRFDAYDFAYEDTMNRIEGQQGDEKELAKQVLSWITCAKRPLTTSELQHALAVEVGESELDIENLPQVEDIISVCAGLVTVDEERNVRLVHYTTQEYFERTKKDWFPHAQTEITSICITYLSFGVFQSGFCQTNKEFEERLQLYPLYDYAAQNWGHHAREDLTLCREVVDFLQCEATTESSSQALMAVKQSSSHLMDSQQVPRRVTGLHLAAYFGIRKAANDLLEQGHSPDLKDSYNQTPLSYAAEQGCEAIVKLLLSTKVDSNSKGKDGRTPLSRAAANGHEAVVKLLLDRKVEVDSKDNNGRTPLSCAAANGHEAVVKLLLERQVNANSKDESDWTPLHWAAKNGQRVAVEALIKAGATIDSTDRRGSTALHESIRRDHQAVQELLIDSGANLDIQDNDGQTPSDLAWSKKRLDWSTYDVNETVKISQGTQARCAVLRRKDSGETPKVSSAPGIHPLIDQC